MKTIPFTSETIAHIADTYGTPLYLYDEAGIRATAQYMQETLGRYLPGYKNYFAVKALPNPHILALLMELGMGVDASSMGELLTAERVGLSGDRIMFSSNDTPIEDFRKADELGAMVNFDDVSHIAYFQQQLGHLPGRAALRFNPGPEKAGNVIIGDPKEAKYGCTREQMYEGYRQLKDGGVTEFGIHLMVASNELNADYHLDTARMIFALAHDIEQQVGIRFSEVDLGGGYGIPYRPEQMPLDLEDIARRIRAEADAVWGDSLPAIVTEWGRYVTGPHGYLLSRVRHLKHIYKDYVGLDASMSNLMRPGMYGAYHHITVLGKEHAPQDHTYDVTGSLCENNDKFAIDRQLPEVAVGDLVIIHECGAHAHSMGFQYNAKLRSAEVLVHPDGSDTLIRRAETLDDYFATIV